MTDHNDDVGTIIYGPTCARIFLVNDVRVYLFGTIAAPITPNQAYIDHIKNGILYIDGPENINDFNIELGNVPGTTHMIRRDSENYYGIGFPDYGNSEHAIVLDHSLFNGRTVESIGDKCVRRTLIFMMFMMDMIFENSVPDARCVTTFRSLHIELQEYLLKMINCCKELLINIAINHELLKVAIQQVLMNRYRLWILSREAFILPTIITAMFAIRCIFIVLSTKYTDKNNYVTLLIETDRACMVTEIIRIAAPEMIVFEHSRDSDSDSDDEVTFFDIDKIALPAINSS